MRESRDTITLEAADPPPAKLATRNDGGFFSTNPAPAKFGRRSDGGGAKQGFAVKSAAKAGWGSKEGVRRKCAND